MAWVVIYHRTTGDCDGRTMAQHRGETNKFFSTEQIEASARGRSRATRLERLPVNCSGFSALWAGGQYAQDLLGATGCQSGASGAAGGGDAEAVYQRLNARPAFCRILLQTAFANSTPGTECDEALFAAVCPGAYR